MPMPGVWLSTWKPASVTRSTRWPRLAAYPVYFAGALDIRHITAQRISYGVALVIVDAIALARSRAGCTRDPARAVESCRRPEAGTLHNSVAGDTPRLPRRVRWPAARRRG
jgi:hypothetical protein